MPASVQSVAVTDARRHIAAGEAKADELGVLSDLAVVCAGGNLIAYVRMDGARLGSIGTAVRKARMGRPFDMSNEDLSKMAPAGKPQFGSTARTTTRSLSSAGGAPIRSGNVFTGGSVQAGAPSSGRRDRRIGRLNFLPDPY